MNDASKPIGIFDSGVGGLTVFAALQKLLPHESLIYLGDTARVPYGTKSPETVIRYSIEDADFLLQKGVKALVVACNTASAHALSALTEHCNVPVIGVVEPGAEEALRASKKKCIGVIGTEGTIVSGAYERTLKKLHTSVQVISRACPLFVPLVEEGWLAGDVTCQVAKKYLLPLLTFGIDTLVLGCTHYPLLSNLIQSVVGNGIRLIDSAEATAKAVSVELQKQNLLGKNFSPTRHLFVTDLPARFTSVAETFLQGTVPPVMRVTL